MSSSIVQSRGSIGIYAPPVAVEAFLSNGLPHFAIVGLPETAVKESKDRVRSALLESGFTFPGGRITINLAPADLPKEGGRFDLPIAISILLASKQIQCSNINEYEFAGELALSGALRPIKGCLPFALGTQQVQRKLVIPPSNVTEATWVSPLTIYAFNDLLSVCAHLSGKYFSLPVEAPIPYTHTNKSYPCFSEVCGQQQAKRALEVAAAGGHSLLMIGPPGTGKTMLASRLNGILPSLTQAESLEVAALYSISRQGINVEELGKRPFRRPHHTASAVSLVGGGRTPLPGEISLAHRGVLFLDELPEFSRHVLEVLREPLESGKVFISRAAGQAEYPAQFQLIGAMNPCPCGYLGEAKQSCQCSTTQIHRYRSKISGPMLDRIDMHIEVATLNLNKLSTFEPSKEEKSEVIQQRVCKAREKQLARSAYINAHLTNQEITSFCKLDSETQQLLTRALDKLGISARAYHRILKVARTIADLANEQDISEEHIYEAVQYRQFDRQKNVNIFEYW